MAIQDSLFTSINVDRRQKVVIVYKYSLKIYKHSFKYP